MKETTVSDRLWIWGHPTNSLINHFGLTKPSNVTIADSTEYFSAKNTFYIPMGRLFELNKVQSELKNAAKLGWSVEADNKQASLANLLEHAKKSPNTDRLIYDDFFHPNNGVNNYTQYPQSRLNAVHDRINSAGLSMWCVYYRDDDNADIARCLNVFDGVAFWFWKEPEEADYHTQIERFFDDTRDKQRMIGCYLYNFGLEKEADPDMVTYQLDNGLEYMRQGLAEGIILHTNAVGDMGFRGYEAAKIWTDAHKDDRILF